MGRVQVGVEEADHHRLHVLNAETAHRLADRGLVERLQHRAVRVQALGDLEAPAPRHERRRLLQVDVVEPRADLAADLQDVAEAAGHQHADPRGLALDDRVGGHRGGVHHRGHVAAARAALGQPALQRGHEAAGGVFRRGEHLHHPGLAGAPVHQRRVGERAPDVDAHAPRRRGAAHGRVSVRAASVAASSTAWVTGCTTTP